MSLATLSFNFSFSSSRSVCSLLQLDLSLFPNVAKGTTQQQLNIPIITIYLSLLVTQTEPGKIFIFICIFMQKTHIGPRCKWSRPGGEDTLRPDTPNQFWHISSFLTFHGRLTQINNQHQTFFKLRSIKCKKV